MKSSIERALSILNFADERNKNGKPPLSCEQYRAWAKEQEKMGSIMTAQQNLAAQQSLLDQQQKYILDQQIRLSAPYITPLNDRKAEIDKEMAEQHKKLQDALKKGEESKIKVDMIYEKNPFLSMIKKDKKETKGMFKYAKEWLDEHKNIVMPVLLALVADHFLLGGVFRERIKSVLSKLLAGAEKKVDQLAGPVDKAA